MYKRGCVTLEAFRFATIPPREFRAEYIEDLSEKTGFVRKIIAAAVAVQE